MASSAYFGPEHNYDVPDFGDYPIPPTPTAADRGYWNQLLYNVKYGNDDKLSLRDFFRWVGMAVAPGAAVPYYLGKTGYEVWRDRREAERNATTAKPENAPWQYNGYEYNNSVFPEYKNAVFPEAPEDPYKYNEAGYRTMENMGWMGGDPTDPFGYMASAGGPEDDVANMFSARGQSRAQRQQENRASNAPAPSRGTTVSILDMPEGPDIPMISGPKWEGPPGLPWTYGADPRSYPYAYIPPGGSWANHPGAAPWPGAEPNGAGRPPGTENPSGPPGSRVQLGPQDTDRTLLPGARSPRDWNAPDIASEEYFLWNPTTGETRRHGGGGGGTGASPSSWGDFSGALPSLINPYY